MDSPPQEHSFILTPEAFFDLNDWEHRELFVPGQPVWTALDRLKDYLAGFFEGSWPLAGFSGPIQRPVVIFGGEVREEAEVRVSPEGRVQAFVQDEVLTEAAVLLPGAYLFDSRVLLGPGSVVEPGALLMGPTVIGRETQVRQGAYVRGDCLVGHRCVVGHTTEMKASIMLDGAKAGHFAYVGDSILGRRVNLGAGTKLANFKMIPGKVAVVVGADRLDTGRRKLGAVLGDGTETGCNSVTSPGTLLGPGSIVYPGVAVPSGSYPAKTRFAPAKDSLRISSPKG